MSVHMFAAQNEMSDSELILDRSSSGGHSSSSSHHPWMDVTLEDLDHKSSHHYHYRTILDDIVSHHHHPHPPHHRRNSSSTHIETQISLTLQTETHPHIDPDTLNYGNSNSSGNNNNHSSSNQSSNNNSDSNPTTPHSTYSFDEFSTNLISSPECPPSPPSPVSGSPLPSPLFPPSSMAPLSLPESDHLDPPLHSHSRRAMSSVGVGVSGHHHHHHHHHHHRHHHHHSSLPISVSIPANHQEMIHLTPFHHHSRQGQGGGDPHMDMIDVPVASYQRQHPSHDDADLHSLDDDNNEEDLNPNGVGYPSLFLKRDGFLLDSGANSSNHSHQSLYNGHTHISSSSIPAPPSTLVRSTSAYDSPVSAPPPPASRSLVSSPLLSPDSTSASSQSVPPSPGRLSLKQKKTTLIRRKRSDSMNSRLKRSPALSSSPRINVSSSPLASPSTPGPSSTSSSSAVNSPLSSSIFAKTSTNRKISSHSISASSTDESHVRRPSSNDNDTVPLARRAVAVTSSALDSPSFSAAGSVGFPPPHPHSHGPHNSAVVMAQAVESTSLNDKQRMGSSVRTPILMARPLDSPNRLLNSPLLPSSAPGTPQGSSFQPLLSPSLPSPSSSSLPSPASTPTPSPSRRGRKPKAASTDALSSANNSTANTSNSVSGATVVVNDENGAINGKKPTKGRGRPARALTATAISTSRGGGGVANAVTPGASPPSSPYPMAPLSSSSATSSNMSPASRSMVNNNSPSPSAMMAAAAWAAANQALPTSSGMGLSGMPNTSNDPTSAAAAAAAAVNWKAALLGGWMNAAAVMNASSQGGKSILNANVMSMATDLMRASSSPNVANTNTALMNTNTSNMNNAMNAFTMSSLANGFNFNPLNNPLNNANNVSTNHNFPPFLHSRSLSTPSSGNSNNNNLSPLTVARAIEAANNLSNSNNNNNNNSNGKFNRNNSNSSHNSNMNSASTSSSSSSSNNASPLDHHRRVPSSRFPSGEIDMSIFTNSK